MKGLKDLVIIARDACVEEWKEDVLLALKEYVENFDNRELKHSIGRRAQKRTIEDVIEFIERT